MRKFDLSLRSSRSSYFETFRHQVTVLSQPDALEQAKGRVPIPGVTVQGVGVREARRGDSVFHMGARKVAVSVDDVVVGPEGGEGNGTQASPPIEGGIDSVEAGKGGGATAGGHMGEA